MPPPRRAMQRPNQAKRESIIKAAAEMFASRPFHEVTLDEVAARAKVGKGTLYTYFDSKESLFSDIVDEAFVRLVAEIRGCLDRAKLPAWEQITIIVREVVRFGQRFPDRFRLMRQGVNVGGAASSRARDELVSLIESVLRAGVKRGELIDPYPDLSASFVISCVRGALLYGTSRPENTIVTHILRVLGQGLLPGRTGRHS